MGRILYRLKISQADFTELQRLTYFSLPKESGAFALAGIATRADGTDILVRRPIEVPQELFSVQHEYRLEIAPKAVNGLIALCEGNGLGAVLCHSHPKKIPYSPSDDDGESRIAETLRPFIPTNAPVASLLFYPDGVCGRIWPAGAKQPVMLSEIIIIGRTVQRIHLRAPSRRQRPVDTRFDRQVLAFGELGQRLIAQAKVGIVGVGGTGSPTAEQLVRLGVSDLVLVDPDGFDPSNITRVYGTFFDAVRKAKRTPTGNLIKKVDLVARHLKRINPRVKIRVLPASIIQNSAAQALLDRDLVFLCTDNDWSRAIVNEIAYQYFIPTVNLGARIDSDHGAIRGAMGAVDVLRPDLPCLWCRQSIRTERITAESTPADQRQALQREGYVEGVDTPAPSVVSVTTTVSGLGVTLLLQLLTDFMRENGDISRLNYDIMTGMVRRGTTAILSECVCKKMRGYGDLKRLNTLPD